MKRRKGFTLVELLTVISIIALLMGIIMPALSGVRRKAKAAVCLSNLRQWGMVYKMYTDEFDGRLPRDYGDAPWYYPIRNYYSNERKIILCPSAKKTSGQNSTFHDSQYGGTFTAWEFSSPFSEEIVWNSIGSYGLNGWAYKYAREVQVIYDPNNESNDDDDNNVIYSKGRRHRRKTKYPIPPSEPEQEEPNEIKQGGRYWEIAYENMSNNIPMIFDSTWLYSHFDDKAGPPSSEEDKTSFFGFSNTTCINRHDGGINFVFMDFSARKVGLKELWTLKWHKEFNTAGPWTKAGGVLPENWPKWMHKYKDY